MGDKFPLLGKWRRDQSKQIGDFVGKGSKECGKREKGLKRSIKNWIRKISLFSFSSFLSRISNSLLFFVCKFL